MDSIMDPELSSEMVKLLAQELKAVRAQLREAERRTTTPYMGSHSDGLTHEMARELISENDTLKVANAALQDRLTQVSSLKSEEDLHGPLRFTEPASHMSEEFARLLAENEDLIREKVAEEASRNEKKLSIVLEKYRRSKAKVHEYNKMLDELRVALSNCIEELEQSRKAAVAEIDFRALLVDLPYEPVEGQLGLSSIRPYPRGVHTRVHKDAVGVCKRLYFLDSKEVIWSPSGIALGLVIKPTFKYNPKKHAVAWSELEDGFGVGERMDLCYSSSKGILYLGTYERVAEQGTMVIASQALKNLDRVKLMHASERTTLFPDLVPPSQTHMIKNMYEQGVIKLQCFVIRCVAVNLTFVEKLRDTDKSSVQRNPSDSTVMPASQVTSGSVRKRKQGPESTVHLTRSKKRYELLRKTWDP